MGVADAEPLQHFADLLLQAPGLALVHPSVELAQFGQEGPIVLAPFVGAGEGLTDLGVAPQQLHLLAAVGEDLLEHGSLRIHLRLLAHQDDARLGEHPAAASARGLKTGQDAHQGGLPGAVGANQAQAFPFADVEGQPVEEGADAEVLADIHQADQAHRLGECRCASR